MASAAAARARMERVAEHPDSGKEGSALFNDALNTFYLQSRNIHTREGNALFNDALNTYCLRLYGVGEDSGRKEMLYLTTHSTHFIYGYMASAAAARARTQRVAEHPDSGREGSALFNDALNTFYLQSRNIHTREGNALFNDALNTFCLRLYGVGEDSGRKEMIYLTTHSTHFIYGPETSSLGKEGNALFNNTINTFYLRSRLGKEMFYLTMHSTHSILRLYGVGPLR